MAVLNTTSPPVSPAAPADSPSYQVPFSSASVAFILSLVLDGNDVVHEETRLVYKVFMVLRTVALMVPKAVLTNSI